MSIQTVLKILCMEVFLQFWLKAICHDVSQDINIRPIGISQSLLLQVIAQPPQHEGERNKVATLHSGPLPDVVGITHPS